MHKSLKKQTILLIIIILITPIGFATKFYMGFGWKWVHNYGGAILYEIFWCFILAFVFQKLSNIKIVLIVFSITSVLEVLQLWRLPSLVWIRSYFIGRTLLGTTFVWWDFFYYALGCWLGFYLLQYLNRKCI